MNRILIINSDLFNPPSETATIRCVALWSKIKLDLDIIAECNNIDMKDIYWSWIKKTYLSDFIKDLVMEQEMVEGVRISAFKEKDPCIRVDRIVTENMWDIIDKVSYFK